MRSVMFTYACIYMLLLFANIHYWIKYKGSFMLLLYELLSGFYMVFLIFACFTPEIKSALPIWAVLPVIGVILFDFYMSVLGNIRKFTPKNMTVSDRELEYAQMLSVIFAAPAYIIAILLLVDLCQAALP